MKNIALFFILSVACVGQNYKAVRAVDHRFSVIRLTDAAQGVEVSIAPAMGNRTYEMKVHGKNILYFPAPDISQAPKTGGLNGIPVLAPWANRLGEMAFWANDKQYLFNPTLGNVRSPIPSHPG